MTPRSNTPQSSATQMSRNMRPPRRVGGSVWLWSAGLTLLAGVSVLLAWFALRPDLMVVDVVRFEGASQASVASLRHFADVPNGTTVWELDEQAVAESVRTHPWVRSAEAQVGFRGELVITVHEHVPVALLSGPDGLVYVDAAGQTVLPASTELLDLPVIAGVIEGLDGNPAIVQQALVDAVWLIDALDSRSLVDAGDISELRFKRMSGWRVVLSNRHVGVPGAELLFRLGDYPSQLDRLEALVLDGKADLSLPARVDLGMRGVARSEPLADLSTFPSRGATSTMAATP